MSNRSDTRISMVVATLGRSGELEPLLASLAAQRRRDFELIVVDQNRDDRLVSVLAGWRDDFEIVHIRTPLPGVCRARNLGATKARGEWLLFPDDDCWYPDDFMARLDSLRKEHSADFYCGRAVNLSGETIMGNFSRIPAAIVRANVWTTLIEWMLLVRSSAFLAAGGFDEQIGPGSGTPWGAYEVQDLALSLLSTGAKGFYDPALTGFHPDDISDRTSPESIAKMRTYSSGLGYVMRKHGFGVASYLPRLLRPLAGVAVYGLTGRTGMAQRSLEIFRGRWSGWTDAPRSVHEVRTGVRAIF
ncbi:glycosyltransferase family A protein [Sinorhizobium sp. BG8]|uniref:glycosyltransferase family 2 protein n=1 Tax=Sinorhizobium sp. BG8 TaxID=2613773 RepID=UPI00193D1705|nr:glycosyltransferase family A protein [Sinorhizobium sp. BG8]